MNGNETRAIDAGRVLWIVHNTEFSAHANRSHERLADVGLLGCEWIGGDSGAKQSGSIEESCLPCVGFPDQADFYQEESGIVRIRPVLLVDGNQSVSQPKSI